MESSSSVSQVPHEPKSDELPIAYFKTKSIVVAPTIIFVGMRGTGKSILLRNVVYDLRDRFTHGIVFSRTEGANRFWANHIPSLFIFTEFDDEPIWQLIDAQISEIRRIGFEAAGEAFLIVDDMGLDRKFTHSEVLKEMAANGRHYKIAILITTQYGTSVPPDIRGNMSYVFVLRERNIMTRVKLHEQYCGEFKTFALFEHVLRACTEQHECLVVDKTAETWDLGEQIYYFRSRMDLRRKNDPDANEFKLGSQEYKDFAVEHDNGTEMQNMNASRQQKLRKLGLLDNPSSGINIVKQEEKGREDNPFYRTPSAMYASEYTNQANGRLKFMNNMIDAQNEKFQEAKTNPHGSKHQSQKRKKKTIKVNP